MRVAGLSILVISALAGCSVELPAGAQPSTSNAASPRTTAPEAVEQAVELLIDDVNRARGQLGVSPLLRDQRLDTAASELASEMAATGDLDLGSGRMDQAIDEAGYTPYQIVASAAATNDVELLLEDWGGEEPQIFERWSETGLRDLGIGWAVSRDGRHSFVALAGVSQRGHYGALALQLGTLADVRRRMFDEVNRVRREHHRRPLAVDDQLDRAAQLYAEDMLARNFYGHRSPEGESVLERVEAAGYKPVRVGENLAYGQPTVEQTVKDWLASPEHRANLLHPEFNALGTGLAHGPRPDGSYALLWVQVLGRPMP